MDPLTALGDPSRRAIFEHLAERPRAVVELADALPVSRPAISQNLKVLKQARLVTDRAVGTRRIYRLDLNGVGALRADRTSARSGRSRPITRRPAKSRCDSSPKPRSEPASNSNTAISSVTATAGKASAPAWAATTAGPCTSGASRSCSQRRGDSAYHDRFVEGAT